MLVVQSHLDSDCPIVFKQHPRNISIRPHIDTGSARVLQTHLVEPRPLHLPGSRPLPLDCLREIKRIGLLPRRRDESHTLFHGEVTAAQLFQEPQPLECVVGVRNERFPDVIARKLAPLQHEAAMAFALKQRSECCAGGSATNDNDVVGRIGCDHG